MPHKLVTADLNDLTDLYMSDLEDASHDSSQAMIKQEHNGKSVFIGWSLLPRLFEIWDFDESGFIDRKELLFGIKEYCTVKNITYNEQKLFVIMDEVDTNHDNQLDMHEFSLFLFKFVELVGSPFDDVIYYLLEILDANRSAGRLSCNTKRVHYTSLIHLLRNTIKLPLPRRSISSVSSGGTSASESSLALDDNLILQDFQHVGTHLLYNWIASYAGSRSVMKTFVFTHLVSYDTLEHPKEKVEKTRIVCQEKSKEKPEWNVFWWRRTVRH